MEPGRIEISWNTNFTMIPNEIWNLDLEIEERIIFMYLVRLKSNQEEISFPSYQTIAETCKIRNKAGKICKVKTRRVIEKMNSMGLITKMHRKKKNGEFGSNIYTLTHPSTLLKPLESTGTEEEEYEIVTPVSKPKVKSKPKPVKTTPETSDTGVTEDGSLENTDLKEDSKEKNVTYKDLSTKTYLKKDDDRSIREDFEKKEQHKLLQECYELISRATGQNSERVKLCINPKLFWKVDLKELITAFSKSKYLQGKADKKVPISTFGSKTQLNKVIGGFYEDRPEEKPKSTYKPSESPCVIKNQGQDYSEFVKEFEDNITEVEKLKGQVSKDIVKTGQLKLITKLSHLNTLEQIQEFREQYHL